MLVKVDGRIFLVAVQIKEEDCITIASSSSMENTFHTSSMYKNSYISQCALKIYKLKRRDEGSNGQEMH